MKEKINTENICALILCGGLGKRLRSIISDRPKPMAEINRRPFLDFLISHLREYGVKKIILCTGYKASVIKKYYQHSIFKKIVSFSREDKPLGTGGCIRNAFDLIDSNHFLVMNGDSMCKVNLKNFLKFHLRKNAAVSIALTTLTGNREVGLVCLDRSKKILSFLEKGKKNNKKRNYVNSGVYLFDKKVIRRIPENEKYSLEFDLFPVLGNCYGYVTHNKMFDIGTPIGYQRAQQRLKKI